MAFEDDVLRMTFSELHFENDILRMTF
jgi:hypothetical protein